MRVTSPNAQTLLGAPVTSAVTVMVALSSSASVTVVGVTSRTTPPPAVAVTSHVPAVVAVTVRSQEHSRTHWLFAMLGTFRVFGSPPDAGSAAR